MQIVNLKCTLITCKSTAVKCIILCNIYEVSFSQNVTFDRVSREIEDFLKGKQEEI
jgi:hypothetical protein